MPKLYPFQRIGVRRGHFKFKDRFLLADDMGLGKTVEGIWSAKVFWKEWPILVVCPASLKLQWQAEINHHLGMTSTILEGRQPRYIPKSRIIIVNYDILWDWADKILEKDIQGIIVDESHYCKNPRAKRTKAVKFIQEGLKRKIFMSGTPIENRPAEIWPVLHMLRPNLFPTFRPFGIRYCKPQNTPWGTKYNGAERTEELHEILVNTCMVRRRKAEVLKDLPPKRRMVVPIALPNKEMKEYKKAEQELIRWLIATKNVKGMDRQNTRRSMFIRLKVLVGRMKLPIVKEWIHNFMVNTDRKLITCAVHRHVIEELRKEFEDKTIVVHGGITGRKRQEAVDRFMKRTKYRHFVGQIKAAGVGLNLQAASSVLFAELNWNPAEHTQFEDRAHRIGQKNPVDVYYLVAEDTIEQRQCELIQTKQKIVDAVLDGKESDESLLIMDMLEESLLGKRYK